MKFYPDSRECELLMHYTLQRVFSLCVMFMWLIGGRGFGKTYSTKTFVIKDFIKNGNKFAWVRTTDRALDKIRSEEQFFGRLKNLKQLGVKKYVIKNDMIYINDKLAGYLFAVSTFYNNKGADYVIKNVVWDEFMRAKGERPLTDKFSKFMDLVQSVCRTDRCRVIGLSNSTNQYDEVLQQYNLTLKEFGVYLFREKSALVHYIRPSKTFLAEQEKSLSGYGMSEQDKKMAFKNEFTDYGDYARVEKLTYNFTIQVDDLAFLSVYQGKEFTVVKNSCPPDAKMYAIDNTFVNSKVKKLTPSLHKFLKLLYSQGQIKFDTGFTRTAFQDKVA